MPPPTTTTSKRRIRVSGLVRARALAERADHGCNRHGLDEVRAAIGELERELDAVDFVDRPAPGTSPEPSRGRQILVIGEQEFGSQGFEFEARVRVVGAQAPADGETAELPRQVNGGQVE